MKLRFLCANHREWLYSQPDQALHSCANSFETGWHLCQRGQWKDALPHMGCAFEAADIVLTRQVIAPAHALEWFVNTLEGLTGILEKLDAADTCDELYQVAIDRLRKTAAGRLSPELEASLYTHITRLNHARKQLGNDQQTPGPLLTLRAVKQGEIVFH